MEIANNNNNKMNNAIALKQLLADANKYFTDTNLDVPGIQWFEHLNIQVGSKVITETFYRDILGFTSDPSPSFRYNLGLFWVELLSKRRLTTTSLTLY